MPLAPYLSRYWDAPGSWTLESYLAHDGYAGLRAALATDPDTVTSTVLEAGLRGRGGAGFPTGRKWSFIPQPKPGETPAPGAPEGKPKYLVVNADESEPGTCKDMPLMMATPHVLVVHEGESYRTPVVAIGAIEGELGDDGTLLIDLNEVDNSGYEGRAYFEPDDDDDDDDDEVEVTVGIWEVQAAGV